MKRLGNLIILIGIIQLLCSSIFAEELVMFSYQGKVKVQGQNFDGTGLFKFAIVNNAGNISLWSNDQTSTGGAEPTDYVAIGVSDGIFNVMIGDPDIGMEPINNVIFNQANKIKLRIWFSDGIHGFQQLLPDRQILNPQLMGIRSGNYDFTIYVNAATGNDDNSGLSQSYPKKTIQAAVDVLPERLSCNVTIDIADGVYREQLKVYGIVLAPDKTLTFIGDETWNTSSPGDPTVRITGNDHDTTGVKVRDYVIQTRECSGVIFKGLLLDNGKYGGVLINGGSYSFISCKTTNNGGFGFRLENNSRVNFDYCLSTYNTGGSGCGFGVSNNSSASLQRCIAKYNDAYGAWFSEYGSGSFYTNGVFSNNSKSGIMVGHNSRAWFSGSYTGQINYNTLYGIEIRYDSYTEDYTRNSFSGNGSGSIWIDSATGGHSYF